MAIGNVAVTEQRRVARDEVFHRARGHGGDGRALALLIVNMSPCGLMARCDDGLAEGDDIRVALPGVGTVDAQVRWSLGGRVGCEFAAAIPPKSYYEALAGMLRA